MRAKRTRLRAVIVLSLALLSWAIYWAFFEREHLHWTEQVILLNGESVIVTHHASNKIYHGHPHAFGWGGGDPHHEMRIMLSPEDAVTWQGISIPIVLQFQNDTAFLITFDRETDFRKVTFRYYRFDGQWQEILPTDYPKQLARQNMWLDKVREVEALKKMDPTDPEFQRSLTAAIWLQLEEGTEYYEQIHPSEDFLRHYIHANMR